MFDNLAMDLIKENEAKSLNHLTHSQRDNDFLGKQINETISQYDGDIANHSVMREDIMGFGIDGLNASPHSKKNFNFLGIDSPNTYLPDILTDAKYMNELIAAQSALEKYKVVDTQLTAAKSGLPLNEINSNIKIMAGSMKSLSSTNPYMEIAAKVLEKQSPEFKKAYRAAEIAKSFVKAPDYIHGRMNEEMLQTIGMQSEGHKIFREAIADGSIMMYVDGHAAYEKAISLAHDTSLSAKDFRAALTEKPDMLGEIKPIKKGRMIKRNDKAQTGRYLAGLKSDIVGYKKSLEAQVNDIKKNETSKITSLEASISAPSIGLSKAYENIRSGLDIMKGQGKGVEIDSLVRENQSIVKSLENAGMGGKTHFQLKTLKPIRENAELMRKALSSPSITAARTMGV